MRASAHAARFADSCANSPIIVDGITHVTKRKFAFTLAEVLITLGIIGVVASLTIPSLIQSYKKQAATARLKKFYSTMEQAIKLSEIDNGPVEYWSKIPCATCYMESDGDYNTAAQADRDQVVLFYNTYIKPYLKVTQEDSENSAISKKQILVYLSDGSTFTLHNGDCTDFRYDVNGIMKKPNVVGKDIFAFVICPNNFIGYGLSSNQKFRPLVSRKYIIDESTNSISREKLLERCKTKLDDCAGLLMIDNWEFKDDYPFKL